MMRLQETDADRFLLDRADGARHFFRRGVRATGDALAPFAHLTGAAFMTFAGVRAAEIDHLNRMALDAFARRQSERRVECSDRCAACCYQHVVITATEAFLIAKTAPMAEQLWPAMVAQARQVADVSHAERYQRRLACPLLVDERCSAYAFRPAPCRSHFSTSRAACEGPSGTPVPMLGEPKLYGEALAMGCDFALMTVGSRPLQMVAGELAAMMALALMRGAFAAWLEGEAVFPPGIFRPDRRTGDAASYELALRAAAKAAGVKVDEALP